MSGIDLDKLREDLDDSAGGGIVGWRAWRDHADALLVEVERLTRERDTWERRFAESVKYAADMRDALDDVINKATAATAKLRDERDDALARVPPPAGQGEGK